MLLDLDGFKAVNDQYGHAAGDELLQLVALRLQGVVRDGDMVARLGGDEFAVVMRGAVPVPAVERVAKGICEALSSPMRLAAAQVGISCSVGVTVRGADGVPAEELVRQADVAMYQVKRGGRCGFRWFGG
jgi:diguanylate cyclase (GGDEF)-like protein